MVSAGQGRSLRGSALLATVVGNASILFVRQKGGGGGDQCRCAVRRPTSVRSFTEGRITPCHIIHTTKYILNFYLPYIVRRSQNLPMSAAENVGVAFPAYISFPCVVDSNARGDGGCDGMLWRTRQRKWVRLKTKPRPEKLHTPDHYRAA